MTAKAAYLSSICCYLGASRPISELPGLKAPKDLARFEAMGFSRYLKSDLGPADMAGHSILNSLAASEIDAKDIDVLIYASNSLWEDGLNGTMHGFCLEHGLVNAYPIGVHMNYCGNLGTGFRIALQMILAGDARNVMVVTADTTPDKDPQARLLEPGVAVASDGAASCILSGEKVSRLRLTGTHQHVDHGMSGVGLERFHSLALTESPDFFRYSIASFKGRKSVFDGYYAKHGWKADGIAHLITNNYGKHTLAGFANEAGLAAQQVFGEKKDQIGHVQSADSLLNLKSLLENGSLRNGDRLLMLSTGPYSWSVSGFEYAEADRG
jgi:3-oxoacyl-[acyl-carrier-protein] synthase III